MRPLGAIFVFYCGLLACDDSRSPAGQNPRLDWAVQVGGELWDRGVDIAVAADGSARVVGWFVGTARFADELTLRAVGGDDGFVAAYGVDGELTWARAIADTGYERATAVEVTPDGSAIVTTVSQRGTWLSRHEPRRGDMVRREQSRSVGMPASIRSESDGRTCIAKGARSLATFECVAAAGQRIWSYKATGVELGSMTTDKDGALFAVGSFVGVAKFEGDGRQSATLRSHSFSDVFIIRWSPEGVIDWLRRDGGEAWERAFDVATAAGGDVIVVGSFGDRMWGGRSLFGRGEPAETVLVSAGSLDLFLARFRRDGHLMWAHAAGGARADVATAVAISPDGSIWLTGYFEGELQFGEDRSMPRLTSRGHTDAFIARFRSP